MTALAFFPGFVGAPRLDDAGCSPRTIEEAQFWASYLLASHDATTFPAAVERGDLADAVASEMRFVGGVSIERSREIHAYLRANQPALHAIAARILRARDEADARLVAELTAPRAQAPSA
jgi:hypothetical protein